MWPGCPVGLIPREKGGGGVRFGLVPDLSFLRLQHSSIWLPIAAYNPVNPAIRLRISKTMFLVRTIDIEGVVLRSITMMHCDRIVQ